MNQRDWADRFNHDVDQLLTETGLADLETPSTEYNEMLDAARLLTRTDFSRQSRIRQSLRRRLLNQIEDSLVTTVEIPGLWGLIKNRFRRDRDCLSVGRRRFSTGRFALAALVGLLLIIMVSIPGFQIRENVLTLLAQWRPDPSNVISDDAPGVLQLQWQFTGENGLSSAPVVVEGKLYAGDNAGYLYALDVDTGQEIWRFQTGDSLETAPAVAAGVVYAGSRDGVLYAVEAATGKRLWRFEADAPLTASPAVAAGVVYVGSEDGVLYALEAATGREAWRFQTNGRISSVPTISAGVVYVGSDDRRLYALEAKTGRERWRFRTGNWVSASPRLDETTGLVYAGSHDETMVALEALTGREVWRFRAGDDILAAAAVAHDLLYFGSYDGYLYALEAETGRERWRFWAGKGLRAAPVVAGDLVYIGSGDGYLYAVDALTGQARQRFDAGSQLYTAVAVARGKVYVTSGKGKLHALQSEPFAGEQPDQPAPATVREQSLEAARFQFAPDAWYASPNDQDKTIRFRGRIIDEAGRPVNGFSVEADNGRRRLLSEPGGPNRWRPNRAAGEWEIVISEVDADKGWWWLTVGRYGCDREADFDPHCREFTRLSESVKVEVVYPDEAVITADWVCRRDCQTVDGK